MSDAFSHPVTIVLVLFAVAALAAAPFLIERLKRSGKSSEKLDAELRARWKTWCVLVPLMFGPVLLGRVATILAAAALALLCFREYARATGLFRERSVSAVVVAGTLLTAWTAFDRWYGMFMALAPLLACGLAALEILKDEPKGYVQRVALGIFGWLYFGYGFGHVGFFANDPLGRPALIALFVCVELNDIAGYLVGKPLGKRKLVPNTSPGKTVAGAVGAFVITTLLTAMLMHFVFGGTPVDRLSSLLVLGALAAIGGGLGDLMLSSVKRDVGIKDFDVTLPGHGGLLDRFDSLVLVLPAAFHFLRYHDAIRT